MKIEDLLMNEKRSITKGTTVIPKPTDVFVQKYKRVNDDRKKDALKSAIEDLTRWYNYSCMIEGN